MLSFVEKATAGQLHYGAQLYSGGGSNFITGGNYITGDNFIQRFTSILALANLTRLRKMYILVQQNLKIDF